jgi:hypothetical protein
MTVRTHLLFSALLLSLLPLSAQRYLLSNVNVVDVVEGTVQPSQHILIEGERIEAIVVNPQVIQGRIARTFDLEGQYVMPGLWDMHVHDPLGTEWFDLMLAKGITGVRLMAAEADSVGEWKARLAEGEALPRIVAAARWPGREVLPDSAWRLVDSIQQARADLIAAGRSVSRPTLLAVIRAAKRRDLPVAALLPEELSLLEAIRAGLRSSEGGYGLLAASSLRESYLRDAAWGVRSDSNLQTAQGRRAFILDTYSSEQADTVLRFLGQSDTWLCPTLTRLEALARVRDSLFTQVDERLRYIAPRQRQAWQQAYPDSLYSEAYLAVEQALFETLRNLTGRMESRNVKVLAGSGTGQPYVYPGVGLHDELAHLVAGGMTNQEALRTATYYPVRYLGLSQDLGTVSEGKIADMVILDRNPLLDIRHTREVAGVVLRGKYFQKLALEMKQAKVRDRHQRQEIIPLLLAAYEQGGSPALRDRYRRLEEEDRFRRKYNFDESSLARVGRYLLEQAQDPQEIGRAHV